jgi:hypothetical protein
MFVKFFLKKLAQRGGIKDNAESVPTTVSAPLAQKTMLSDIRPVVYVSAETCDECLNKRKPTRALKSGLIDGINKVSGQFLASASSFKTSPPLSVGVALIDDAAKPRH